MFHSADTCSNGSPLQSAARLVRAGVLSAAVVAIFGFYSQAASASCGDYLFRNGKRVSDRPMSEHPGARHVKESGNATSAPNPSRGCTGPNCSKNPVPPGPIPAAPNSQLRILDPAALLEALIPAVAARHATARPESERGARYLPSSIFRPPIA